VGGGGPVEEALDDGGPVEEAPSDGDPIEGVPDDDGGSLVKGPDDGMFKGYDNGGCDRNMTQHRRLNRQSRCNLQD
jgi:hypothetical protein